MLKKMQFDKKQAYFLFDGEKVETSNVVCLQSYETLIAVYCKRTNTVYETPHHWSRTTSRHLTQWRSALHWMKYPIYSATRVVAGPAHMWRKGYASDTQYADTIVIDCEVVA